MKYSDVSGIFASGEVERVTSFLQVMSESGKHAKFLESVKAVVAEAKAAEASASHAEESCRVSLGELEAARAKVAAEKAQLTKAAEVHEAKAAELSERESTVVVAEASIKQRVASLQSAEESLGIKVRAFDSATTDKSKELAKREAELSALITEYQAKTEALKKLLG